MPDPNPESRPSVSSLLNDLKKTFGDLKEGNWLNTNAKEAAQQASAPVLVEEPSKATKKVEEVVPPVPEQPALVSAEDAVLDWLTPPVVEEKSIDQVVSKESSADTIVHPAAAPTVVGGSRWKCLSSQILQFRIGYKPRLLQDLS